MFAVHIGSISVALSGRIFQGLASDNLLHFNLNAVYVQAPSRAVHSQLIGSSFALYMIGISISPAVAGLFDDFTTSFTMALSIFGFAVMYMGIPYYYWRSRQTAAFRIDAVDTSNPNHGSDNTARSPGKSKSSSFGSLLSPLEPFWTRPSLLVFGLSLFLYNSVQSYIFSAILVFTSLTFGFSDRENGALISLVHAISALYLFTTLFLPKLVSWTIKKSSKRQESSPRDKSNIRKRMNTDRGLALLSLSSQMVSLLLLGFTTESWQVYAVSGFIALSLATPSFIKSDFIKLFQAEDAPKALSALTMMEAAGGLIAPIILGSSQSIRPGTTVFFVAAVTIALAIAFFSTSYVFEEKGRFKIRSDGTAAQSDQE